MTKEQKDELASAEKALAWLEEGKDIRFGEWSLKDVDWLNSVQVGPPPPLRVARCCCWTSCPRGRPLFCAEVPFTLCSCSS
jgi:hypothetical protein